MAYYQGLIKRKFKDVVGSKYETIQKEYSEYILTEEEMRPHEIKTVLLPLDYSVTDVSESICELLSTYENATVTLIYVTDAHIAEIIRSSLDDAAADEFVRKKEEYGARLLDDYEHCLTSRSIRCKRRILHGDKQQDILKLAPEFDMVTLPKCYASNHPDSCSVSANAILLAQSLTQPAIVF
ncbi:universal stress protein [Methanogenium organophilum]|uniref:Universal stress protein n=1 Tax=Methanogenium organophilum TaxID=2199 RepID=A0A9X9S516_METOG|nr:universal stress protein [Methanogenium organophilum]WAI01862.1 universal stress protein [Methanogenium organophilum]